MAGLVAHRYDLTTLIGRGPHGVLWRAHQRDTGEDLAAKLIDARYATDPHVMDRFERESHVLTAFVHPAFVRLRELIIDEGELALVTELVAGSDLRWRLGQWGPVPAAEAVRIAGNVAAALAAAHAAAIVHCDIKPTNLLFSDAYGDVRITDCRVARLIRGHRAGLRRFTDPRYAAPEVILGGPPIPATDVYGLGLVLYEMVHGTPLARGDEPADVLAQHLHRRPIAGPDLSGPLGDVLEQCLAPDPAARPPAADVVALLRRARHQVHGGLRPPISHIPSPRPRPRENPDDTGGSAGGAATERGPGPPRLLRRGVVTAVVVAVLLAAALVGSRVIGGTDERPPGGTTASSGGANLASGVAAPPLPAGANAASADGATAFVRYWFDLLNYATVSGDTAALDAVHSPECQPCTTVSRSLRAVYQGGGTLRGGRHTVRNITISDFFSLGQHDLIVVYDRSPRSTVDAGGRPIGSLPATTFAKCEILLERDGDRWRVRTLSGTPPT